MSLLLSTDGVGEFPSSRFESQSFGSFSTSYPEEGGESTSVKGASDDRQNLPPPEVFLPEEGVALKEWRRENAIRLEEKEKREKEILNEIIEEAEDYKTEFYMKWKVKVENNKATNREKEKLLRQNQEKFDAEASKNYWKAAAEMIPREIPTIEKKGKKKESEKNTSIVVVHGPKPGKPTDLSRMRQVFLKLKHKPPAHIIPPPSIPSSPSSSIPGEEFKTGASLSASTSQAAPEPSSVTAD